MATRFVHSWQMGLPLSDGWTWMVRARVDGRWTAWSEQRRFASAPTNVRPAQSKELSKFRLASWTPSEASGLQFVPENDGRAEVMEESGVKALQSKGDYLYFRIDDAVAHDLPETQPGKYWLEIVFDYSPPLRLDVEYDAHPIRVDSNPLYTATRPWARGALDKLNSSTWSVSLPQPRFANRQNGGADFRIRLWDHAAIQLQRVTLYRSEE